MLLIDGVRYGLWTPPNEDEFERVVKEHTKEIFGEQSIYLDLKQKLKSGAGIGSIPDGYVIILGEQPEWHIVEVELSNHPLDQHIVSQVGRFITGINNPNIQRGIVSSIYSEITNDDFVKLKVEKAIKPKEIHYFLDDLISKPPILTVIIEIDTQGLREILGTLAHPQIKVVEFQTFIREGIGLTIHAHLFEPLFETTEVTLQPERIIDKTEKTKKNVSRITILDLISEKIIASGQSIYGYYKGQKFFAEITNKGKILLIHELIDDKEYDSLSGAAKRLTGTSVDGWRWWYTSREDGTECLLDELRKEYRRKITF